MLQYVVRMRRYRKCAEESRALAASAFASNVRDRYAAIAQHYSDLADTEEQSFKALLHGRFNRPLLSQQGA